MGTERGEAAGRPGFRPRHPGVILASAISAAGVSKAAFAAHIGVSRQSLYEVLNADRAVSADMAGRLGRAFGNSTRFWLNLQAAHDAWEIERRPEIAKIAPLLVVAK